MPTGLSADLALQPQAHICSVIVMDCACMTPSSSPGEVEPKNHLIVELRIPRANNFNKRVCGESERGVDILPA